MKNKVLKTYQVNDKVYEFNYTKFANLCLDLSKTMRTKKSSVSFLLKMEEMLDYSVVSSTIKGWMYGNNSPSSIELIVKIANGFKIELDELLIEREELIEMNKTTELNESVKEAVAEIYNRFVDGIEYFRISDGYSMDYYDLVMSNGGAYVGNKDNPTEEDLLPNYDCRSAEDFCVFIRKSRVLFPRKVVDRLLSLHNRIYCQLFSDYYYEGNMFFETHMDKGGIKCNIEIQNEDGTIKHISNISELGPTDYEKFLDGRENNSSNQSLYLNSLINCFYKELDDIFEDYLP